MRGFSAVEVVVGVSLITVVILFSANALSRFLSAGAQQVDKTQALYLTEEVLEMTRFIKDRNWATFQGQSLNTNLYIDYATNPPQITQTVQTIEGMTPYFQVKAVYRDAVTDDIVTSGGVLDTGTRLIQATTTWSGGSVGLMQYVTDFTP